MATLTKDDILKEMGDQRAASRRLRVYRETAKVFSEKSLIDRYPQQWVAAHDGHVVFSSKSLPWLLRQIDHKRLPRHDVMIRYVSRDDRALIVQPRLLQLVRRGAGGLVLIGRYGGTSAGPHLEGLLSLPGLGLKDVLVSFLVDTGAGRCIIGPLDVERLGIDRSRLRGDEGVFGVGGSETYYQEEGYLGFTAEDEGVIHYYAVNMLISKKMPERRAEPLMPREVPSLIGMELIEQWRVYLCPSEGVAEYEVLDSTVSVPIPNNDGQRFAPPSVSKNC